MDKIPVSVLITTKNEEHNIARCLEALSDFDEVIIVDSNSDDRTCAIAREYGVRAENFTWNNAYPKKRQWCLDNLDIQHDFVFFVDADELVTSGLVSEIKGLSWAAQGYFVSGQYVVEGRVLRFGMQNKKLCLFNRHYFEFPVVDDLDIPGMGEIEGHYQPVAKHDAVKIDSLKHGVLHYAFEDWDGWEARHERYAVWEAEMISRNAYPKDPVLIRECCKQIFRAMPSLVRGIVAFLDSYIVRLGFLDGRAGFLLAYSRLSYYMGAR